MNKIIVWIYDHEIQQVNGLPPGMSIEVRDYGTNDFYDDMDREIIEDCDGCYYVPSSYTQNT